ncbi:hypothetical protein [Shewanella algae]|uniref:hypothetical protein n=1 Tax=Shewanella algae TaxID=38313 RepID=UPI0039EC5A17
MDLKSNKVFILLLPILMLSSCEERERPPFGEPTDIQAFLQCKEAVTHDLAAEGSINFGNYSSTAITSKQFITPKNSELSTSFIVKGYVDYTNKYGSLKRYDYECHVTRAEGEHWETDYLNVYYEGFSK